MQFQLCKTNQLSCPFLSSGTLQDARDTRSVCCTWLAHDYARVTWAYGLETVRGEERRSQKSQFAHFNAIIIIKKSRVHYWQYKYLAC